MTVPTFAVAPWWMVEGQAERDYGGDLQNNERDVLQSLPHQRQERLGLLGRDEVLPEVSVTFLQINGVTRETCRHKDNTFMITSMIHFLF